MSIEKECRLIYREAFYDPDTVFEDKLFEYCFEYCKILFKDSHPASMLFALPCSLVTDNETAEAVYIYAAATLEKYRGTGLMSELLQKLTADSDKLFVLRPATEKLIHFYARFGFKTVKTDCSSHCTAELFPLNGYKKLITEAAITPDSGSFTTMYRGNGGIELKSLKFLYSME